MMVQRFVAGMAGLLLLCSTTHAAPPDVTAGKAAFQKCASCHAVGPAAQGGFAPQLNGIVGRKAGITKDYAYSAVLKNANFTWTEHNLAGFLRNPGQFVPGNKMRFWGISDEQELANLIAYMKTFAPPAPRTSGTTAGK
jgi:cytochrome c